MLLISTASGFAAFMAWLIALNGFIGNETAVSFSLASFLILAVISALIVTAVSSYIVFYFTERRSWHGAAATLTSVVLFTLVIGVVHLICVVLSAIVASVLRN